MEAEHPHATPLDPRQDLSAYRLVLAARLYVVDEPTAVNLISYVKNVAYCADSAQWRGRRVQRYL